MIRNNYLKHIAQELNQSKSTAFFVLTLTVILGIGMFSVTFAQEDSKIPAWIKTAVGFWVDGQLSDDEFLNAIEYFVENEMIHVHSQTSNNNDNNATMIDNLHVLQKEINMKIDQSKKLVSSPQIQQPLIESNTSFAENERPEEIIQNIEESWSTSDDEDSNSVTFYLTNSPTSEILRSIIHADQQSDTIFKYAEIFITNQYGVNVIQSHKTSDYIQNDEKWWQKAKQNGLYLSEGGYDESAGVYASDIAISILDEDGNFIGILKAVINVESIINSKNALPSSTE